ncbi:apolipoprotein A-I [Lampris incognitus]|uniref:apolipoprotein A-I n=1 Tax=Lampris incognitus TaxID=2546036 RepID=UPI0024B536CA|nr:apolipoprotein A-I [Lampris incognitus]
MSLSQSHRAATLQEFTMKFLACALTLLLAVGSQARAVQNDAPSSLEQVRAATMLYMNQVKESAQRTLDHLDGTDFAQYKMKLSESLNNLHTYVQTSSHTLTPYGETVSAQLTEMTAQVRGKVMADIDELRIQLEPKREELQRVVQQHIEEYRAKMEPIFNDYMTKSQEEVEALKTKLQPLMEEMRGQVAVNVEETKAKLMPMVETVRSRLNERLEELRSLANPYVAEYKEQLTSIAGDLKDTISPHTQNLQTMLEPYMEDLKTKVMSLYERIAQAINA